MMHTSSLFRRHGIPHRAAACHKLATVVPQIRQPEHTRQRVTAWKEGRRLYMAENEPFVTTHRFDVISATPEKAIYTNPDVAETFKVPRFHPGYRVMKPERQLRCKHDFPDNPQMPEAVLRHNASAFQGTMASYVVGVMRGEELAEEYNFGTGYLLTPHVKAPGSDRVVVFMGTAGHNVADVANLRYRVGAEVLANPWSAPLVDVIPASTEIITPCWSLDDVTYEAVLKLNGPAPVPKSVGETPAYPPLQIPATARPKPIKNSPDVAMLKLDAEEGFPFNQLNDWSPGMKKDWLVPAYVPTNDLMRMFIAIAGFVGSVTDLDEVQVMYGAKDIEAAEELAKELSLKILPAQTLLVAAGDVVADNGLFLYHRASALAGMSGAAVRSLEHPQLLLGTHIGAGQFNYNVATSVNHPMWCALYVQHILPTIVDVQEWPAPYMPGALAGYLLRHNALLEELGLWQPHARRFVEVHSTKAA